MPFTRKGERKVGRPLSENAAYAEELGVEYRVILRMGGARKLKAMYPEVREILLRPKGGGACNGGLAAHGMKRAARAKREVETAHVESLSYRRQKMGMTVNQALRDDTKRPAFVSGGRAVFHGQIKWADRPHPRVEMDPDL